MSIFEEGRWATIVATRPAPESTPMPGPSLAEWIVDDEAQRNLEFEIHAIDPVKMENRGRQESVAAVDRASEPPVESSMAEPSRSAAGSAIEPVLAGLAPLSARVPATSPGAAFWADTPRTRPVVSVDSASDRLAMRMQSELDGPRIAFPGATVDPVVDPSADDPPADDASLSELLLDDAPVNDVLADEAPVIETLSDNPVWLSWPSPVALLGNLQELRGSGRLEAWSADVASRIDEWTGVPGPTPQRANQILDELRQIADQADTLAAELDDVALREQLQQARYALIRRLDVWEAAVAIWRADLYIAVATPSTEPVRRRLARNVDAVAQLTQQDPAGRSWRDYLLLPSLRRFSERDAQEVDDEERRTARTVLQRLARPRLNRRQREFADQEEITSLEATLRAWAAAPVDVVHLLRDLEDYEAAPRADLAAKIAAEYWSLAWADQPASQTLAERIEQHYRDGNLRVAVSSDLVNRFLPPRHTETGDVNDVIVGADVYGRSTTSTSLHVRALPDDALARIGLEASGAILSETVAVSGPASFRSTGDTTFEARKLIKLTPEGIRVVPSTARASATNNLLGVETQYDGVPLLQGMARGIALSQHEESQGQARLEVEQKVVRQVESRLDAEASAQIAAAHRRLDDRVLRPLRALSLDSIPLEMYSTDRRVITRFRLADEDQLGANVPRPLAPSDSLLSIQIHETTINNALAQLQLDDSQYTLPELYRTVASKFGRPESVPPEDLDSRAVVRFASRDAVQVRFDRDLVRIELSIAEIKIGRNTYDDFKVRAYYKPAPEGLRPTFVREGIVELATAGPPVLRDQLVLRGVFVKLFPAAEPVSIIGDRLDDDARLDGLKITQLVVAPGWVGLAIGPEDSVWTNDLVHTAMK